MTKDHCLQVRRFIKLWNFFWFTTFGHDCPWADYVWEEEKLEQLYNECGGEG